MIKNNYHTHTKYCNHAIGEIEDYIVTAINNGFDELGFSDHMPIDDELLLDEKYKSLVYLGNDFKDRMELAEVNSYIDELRKMKEKYKGKIKVLIGFECEYSDKTRGIIEELHQKTDYLVLGMHHFYSGGRLYNTYSSRDMTKDAIILYAKECEKALNTGYFKCFAHPDLFMFNYMKNEGRLFTKECEDATRIIAKAAIKNNVYLELNVKEIEYSEKAGLKKWRFPREEFWKIISEYDGVKIIIGTDAHKPESLVDSNIGEIEKFAARINLKIEERMII